MNTIATPSLLPLGTQVSVNNGQPRPPERFKRKLADWKCDNYEGVIVRIEEDRYTVQRKPDRGWRVHEYVTFLASGLSAERVTQIPGACLAPLDRDCADIDVTVDVAGLLALEASLTPAIPA